MQVKVTYTSELDDIPEEVSLILGGLANDSHKFDLLVREASKDLKDGETSLAKGKIINCLERLQKMFSRLTDCKSILEGYESAKNPQQTQNAVTQKTEP